MNYDSRCVGQVLPQELMPSAQMSHDAQQGEQKGGRKGRKEEALPPDSPSEALSSPDTPSSPTRIWSAASPSSLRTAPSARQCPWTVRLMSGTTSQCWPRSSVRSPELPGCPGEGSSLLAQGCPEHGAGEERLLPSNLHQCTGSPAWRITTRQASYSPTLPG